MRAETDVEKSLRVATENVRERTFARVQHDNAHLNGTVERI
jgi:hypothetical protein